ncbi:MAG: AMP-binding enzyme [Clostridia bacterium]
MTKLISLIKESASGASVIVAYVICRDRKVFDEASLRRAISESIPHYMLPSAILCVDEFPLTSNGKIDRKALPLPDIAESKKDLPRTQMESKIAEIWEKEMGATAVYREDNFSISAGTP